MVLYYLTQSNLFNAGIAINGAADWKEQSGLGSVMAGLPDGLGSTPEKDPELYTRESPIENIEHMTGEILMVGGALDTQIPPGINMTAFYHKAKKLGKRVGSILFEDEGHLVKKKENLITLWEQIDQVLK